MTSNIFQNDVAIRTKFKVLPSKMIKQSLNHEHLSLEVFFSYLCLRLHFYISRIVKFQASSCSYPPNKLHAHIFLEVFLKGIIYTSYILTQQNEFIKSILIKSPKHISPHTTNFCVIGYILQSFNDSW